MKAFDFHIRSSLWGGRQAAVLIRWGGGGGVVCQPPEKSPKGDEEVLGGEINVSENKSDHPSDVTVMLILDLVFKQIRWVEYTSSTANKTSVKVKEIKEQRQFQLGKEEKKYFI